MTRIHRLRFGAVYLLILFALLLISANVLLALQLHRADQRSCGRLNALRTILLISFEDPTISTPTRRMLALNPSLQQVRC